MPAKRNNKAAKSVTPEAISLPARVKALARENPRVTDIARKSLAELVGVIERHTKAAKLPAPTAGAIYHAIVGKYAVSRKVAERTLLSQTIGTVHRLNAMAILGDIAEGTNTLAGREVAQMIKSRKKVTESQLGKRTFYIQPDQLVRWCAGDKVTALALLAELAAHRRLVLDDKAEAAFASRRFTFSTALRVQPNGARYFVVRNLDTVVKAKLRNVARAA